MKKLLAITIIFLFSGMIIFPSSGIQIDNKTAFNSDRGNTLYVGGNGSGNFSKIQDAIDNASDGDTVFVYDDSSPYKESVKIDKSINLIGENRDTTIIGGVSAIADDIVISGFSITKILSYGGGFGIWSHNNVIYNNKIMYSSSSGIYIDCDAENNIITNNVILHNKGSGILCIDSGNTITWNIIGDNAVDYHSYGLDVHRDGYYHHNDFYMNWYGNAYGFSCLDAWEDGSEGNYWDDWEENPGYPDVYYISSEWGNDSIDYHPSPTSYFNYTIVSIWSKYHSGVNEPIRFEPRINVDPASISSWFWDFGDGNTSDEMEPKHSYSKQGIFNISVTVIDSKGQSDTDISKVYIGEPPDTPIITGPTTCKPGVWYNYTIVANDSDGGLLYYEIDWDDLNWDNIGPYPAGEEITIQHLWFYSRYTYIVRVKAIDEVGFESDWAYLYIQVPRDKVVSNSFLLSFLERYPFLHILLQRLNIL